MYAGCGSMFVYGADSYHYGSICCLLSVTVEMSVLLPVPVRCTNFAQSIHDRNIKSRVGTSFIRSVLSLFLCISNRMSGSCAYSET
jgi:hypothetical protein